MSTDKPIAGYAVIHMDNDNFTRIVMLSQAQVISYLENNYADLAESIPFIETFEQAVFYLKSYGFEVLPIEDWR